TLDRSGNGLELPVLSASLLRGLTTRVGEPVEHAQRPERVPAARLAFAVLHLEVDLALVDVLERPPPVGIPIALDDRDRLRDSLVRPASVAQVVEPAQDVVEIPVWEREPEPARIDHLAGRLPPEEPALEHVLL